MFLSLLIHFTIHNISFLEINPEGKKVVTTPRGVGIHAIL